MKARPRLPEAAAPLFHKVCAENPGKSRHWLWAETKRRATTRYVIQAPDPETGRMRYAPNPDYLGPLL